MYKDIESEQKTQVTQIHTMFSKLKKTSFVDEYVTSHKITPGMGKYLNVEKGYDALSYGPKSVRRCR